MATASSQWYQVAENAQQQLDAILAQRLVLEERLRAYSAEKGGFVQSSPDWPAFSALGKQIGQLQQTVSDAKQKGWQALEAEKKGEEPTPPPAAALKPPADPPPLPADPPPPPPPGPTASAEVKDSNDGATQAPPSPATTTDGRLTTQQAETLAGQTETGTNPPTKPLTETQSVSPNTVSEPIKDYSVEDDDSLNTAVSGAATQGQDPTSFYGDPSVDARDNQPGGAPGAGATDDNPGADGQSRATTVRILNAVKNSYFKPRPNVLNQYASYTYSLSWYLMNPIQYKDLMDIGKINYASYNLLAQSGGAPTQPDAGHGRSPFFSLDYYIDNLEIRSVVTGKGTNRAHNAAEIKFTVTETAGITLIENLYKAVQSVYGPLAKHSLAYYCLVIKFYGYDDNGKLVSANSNGTIVEKIIPFQIKNIAFAVANKVVEYSVSAAAISYTIGFGSNLGVIKQKINITGSTVQQVLANGIAGASVVSPDDGRKTSPAPSLADEVDAVSSLPQNQSDVLQDISSLAGGASPFAVGP